MRTPVLSALLCAVFISPAFAQEVMKPVASSYAEFTSVDHIALSPDGSFFAAVGGGSEKAAVWDAKTGYRAASLQNPGKSSSDALAVAFSPDGKVLATGHQDHKIHLWNTDGWKVTDTWDRHSDPVYCLAFSGDGKRLASGGNDGTVCVCDTATGKLIAKLEGHREAVWSVVLNADGTRAVSSSEKRVQVWDVAKEKVTAILQLGEPIRGGRLALSADGTRVAVTDADKKGVTLWETDTGKHVDTLTGHGDRVTGVAFTDKDKLLVTASLDGKVRTWELPGGKPKTPWQRQKEGVSCLAVSADGKVVVCGGVRTDKGIGGTLAVWPMAGEAEPRYVAAHGGHIRSIAFDTEGRMTTVGGDSRLIQWQKEGGYAFGIHCPLDAGPHAFSPNGKHTALAYHGKFIGLFETKEKARPQELRWDTSNDDVIGLRFLDDGKTLLSAHRRDGGLRTWDVEKAKVKDDGLDKQRDKIIAFDVSKDEKRIVVAASGSIPYRNAERRNPGSRTFPASYVQVLEAENLKSVWRNTLVPGVWNDGSSGPELTGVRFTPDGLSAIASEVQGLQVLDAKTGEVITSYSNADLNSQLNSITRILNIDVSPDGKLLAASMEEWVKERSTVQRVRLFSLEKGKLKLLGVGEGHSVRLTVIAFRPDGKTLVTGDESGVIHFWDVSKLK